MTTCAATWSNTSVTPVPRRSRVPDEVEFATEPVLARQMLMRALDDVASAPWVTGDEVYGADPHLRKELEQRGNNPTPDGLIALTCNEIHHLFNVLLAQPVSDLWHRVRWSTWRRRHKHRARTSHYQRRTAAEPVKITIYGIRTRGDFTPISVVAGLAPVAITRAAAR